MDLDILFWGSQIIAQPDLVIPHPRLHERRFALVPLADVAADLPHPLLGRTVGALLAELPAGADDDVVPAHDVTLS
jgi:2-amino-4-hydroxy-6-hydroxymethyldihydropteridine diphosphokinase